MSPCIHTGLLVKYISSYFSIQISFVRDQCSVVWSKLRKYWTLLLSWIWKDRDNYQEENRWTLFDSIIKRWRKKWMSFRWFFSPSNWALWYLHAHFFWHVRIICLLCKEVLKAKDEIWRQNSSLEEFLAVEFQFEQIKSEKYACKYHKLNLLIWRIYLK